MRKIACRQITDKARIFAGFVSNLEEGITPSSFLAHLPGFLLQKMRLVLTPLRTRAF